MDFYGKKRNGTAGVDLPPLPGKARQRNERAKPSVAGTQGPDLKVHHRPSP